MPGNMKKPGARRSYKKPGEMVLQPVPLPSGSRRKMSPLDKAIMEKRQLPIKGRKRIPSDSDVIIPGTKSSKPKPRRPQGR